METKVCYKIADKRMIGLLFGACWCVYFSTYLGRLNYSACLNEMIAAEGFTRGQGGLIGTGFFLAYGIGQLISGFLGDRLSPKKLVFAGMVVSALANMGMVVQKEPEAMMVCWCINGLAQALVWSPMIRLLFDYLKTAQRMKACIWLNSTVPIGTMTAYGLSALLLKWTGGWRSVFVSAFFLLLILAFLWFIVINQVESYARQHGEPVTGDGIYQENTRERKKMEGTWMQILWKSGFLFLMLALVVQGALKDGVTTWIPTYISETYGLSGILSITGTMIIPVFNLLGVYLASAVNERWIREEVKTASVFFWLCGAALFCLWVCSGRSMIASFFMLAVSTTAMMAVNTMLIAVLPSYFGAVGKASSVSGILNSSVYIGGAVSTYGIGMLSGLIGWKSTIFIWLVCAAVAGGICFIVSGIWKKYKINFLQTR